ncbi:MAG: hypothetical protein OHK0036_03050 [Bacteroidia bacterium]
MYHTIKNTRIFFTYSLLLSFALFLTLNLYLSLQNHYSFKYQYHYNVQKKNIIDDETFNLFEEENEVDSEFDFAIQLVWAVVSFIISIGNLLKNIVYLFAQKFLLSNFSPALYLKHLCLRN